MIWTEASTITDYVLMPNNVVERGDGTLIHERHFSEEVKLADDLWIGPLRDLGNAIMDACEQRGENCEPLTRWFGTQYAVYRRPAPDPFYSWDPDRRISTCLALSRIARPTSLNPYYAARVVSEGSQRMIYPAPRRGIGAFAHVLAEEEDWLRDEDIELLKALLEAYDPNGIMSRVGRALWNHEYAFWTHTVDVRWTLVVTGLEALIHTDDRKVKRGLGSTAQFVTGTGLLRRRIDGIEIAPSDLRDMYEHRSGLAHGQDLGGFGSEKKRLYAVMEETLRLCIAKAILDPDFAECFADEEMVRKNFR